MSIRIVQQIITPDELASYNKRLTICLTPTGFTYTRKTLRGLLLTFGEVECNFNCTMVELTALIKNICDTLHVSPFNFETMDLVVPAAKSVWIPDELYAEEHERDYLGSVTTLSLGMGIFSCHNSTVGAHCVFAADNNIVTAFKIVLPGIDVHCQHSVLVAPQLLQKSAQHPVILLNQRQQCCDIEVFAEGKLQLSNTYDVLNDNERLYRALEVMKSLNIEKDDTELALCGAIERDDYVAMRKYFPAMTLYNGVPLRFAAPEFQHLHLYKYVPALGFDQQ